MYIKPARNSYRLYQIGGAGGGGGDFGDPSTKPPGEKVIQNMGTDELDIELSSLGAGVYLIEPRYLFYKDNISPSNPYGDRPSSDSIPEEETCLGFAYRKVVSGGSGDDFHLFPFERKWVGPAFHLKNSANKPAKGQYFISPIVSGSMRRMGEPKPNAIWYPSDPYLTENYVTPQWYNTDLLRHELSAIGWTQKVKRISTFNPNDLVNATLVTSNLFVPVRDDVGNVFVKPTEINQNLFTNIASYPYDMSAYPMIGLQSHAGSGPRVLNYKWMKAGAANGDTNSIYNPNDWELELVVERQPDKGYTVHRLLYKGRPATYEEAYPYRVGGITSGYNQNTYFSGYWATLIYTS